MIFEYTWNVLMVSLEVWVGSLPTTLQVWIYYYIEIWISSNKSSIRFDNLVISSEIMFKIDFWRGKQIGGSAGIGNGRWETERTWATRDEAMSKALELRWVGRASMKKGIYTPRTHPFFLIFFIQNRNFTLTQPKCMCVWSSLLET